MASNLNTQLNSKKAEAERETKIRNDHRLLCQMYRFNIIRDKSDESILGFADVDRVHLHQYGPETSHADICLNNYLSHPELYNGDPVRDCKCKAVLKFTKLQQQMAFVDVPHHTRDLRMRKLTLFDLSYKNYLKACSLRV